MTEAEKQEIVGLVMTQISSQAVDFDIATEQPQANDLLTAVRQTSSGEYMGVTLKWDDVARIATELANQAAKRAEQAETDANNILTQVQSKGTDITNFVATSKTEIETQKDESVNAVKSVYQTDLNELKGDLDNFYYISESTEEIPLTFNNNGWYNGSSGVYTETTDYVNAKIPVSKGEIYDVTGRTTWHISPYCIIDASGNMLYTGEVSGSSTVYDRSETLTIPQNGAFLVFSSEANNTTWQSKCKCIKHVIAKENKIEKINERLTSAENKIEKGVYKKVENQKKINIAEWNIEGFYTSNKKFNSNSDYRCSKTEIVGGFTYKVKYYSQYTLTLVILDKDDNVLQVGQVSGSGTIAWFEDTFVTTKDAKYIALSSGNDNFSIGIRDRFYIIEYGYEYIPLGEYAINMLHSSNLLYGKKWFATGDSFTHGSLVDPDESPFFEDGIYLGKRKTYPYFIGLRNEMTIINDGLSGSTIAVPNDSYETEPFSVNRYLTIPEDVDYITLWFGINDSNHCTLGTIDDEFNTTFYGAWNIVLRWILTNRPNAKVGIIVTNLSHEGFREATRNIAKKWGIPYLDMMGDYQNPPIVGGREDELGMCEEAVTLRTNHFRISSDNMHPTVNAHRYQSTFIEAFLRRL